MNKRFRLKRDYTCADGTLPAGAEITVYGDKMFFNGGMVEPSYYGILAELITNPELSKKYLQETAIPINKI